MVIDRRFQDGADRCPGSLRAGCDSRRRQSGPRRARAFRADVRRIRAVIAEPPSDVSAYGEWLRLVSSDITVLATRLHDAQHRLPRAMQQRPRPPGGSTRRQL